MKLLILSLLFLSACGAPKGSTSSCDQGGTATLNNQTYSLQNGICTETTQSVTTPTHVQAIQHNICGAVAGIEYENQFYNPALPSKTSSTGYATYADNYYVTPVGSTQCWFKVTGGDLDVNDPVGPTF